MSGGGGGVVRGMVGVGECLFTGLWWWWGDGDGFVGDCLFTGWWGEMDLTFVVYFCFWGGGWLVMNVMNFNLVLYGFENVCLFVCSPIVLRRSHNVH